VTGGPAADDSITLHSSWRGIALSFLGAGAVFAVGITAVIGSGWTVVPTVVFVVGVLLLVGVGFDYPIATTFTHDRIERRALLRRQAIEWSRVRQLTRTRPGFLAAQRKLHIGGLVAVIGRRRYLLVDQVESGAEFNRLDAIVSGGDGEDALSTVIRPDDAVQPTWTYRRKRWAPDPSDGR